MYVCMCVCVYVCMYQAATISIIHYTLYAICSVLYYVLCVYIYIYIHT